MFGQLEQRSNLEGLLTQCLLRPSPFSFWASTLRTGLTPTGETVNRRS